jgi:hypothetical protein
VRRLLLAAGLVALGSAPQPAPKPSSVSEPLPQLRAEHAALSERLQAAVDRDPLAARVIAGKADVILAIRTDFVETLLAEVAHQYFDDVVVDLGALDADADGEVRPKTAVGRLKLGEWQLSASVERLRGRLRAGHPRLAFHENQVDVDVPVEVLPAAGRIALDFEWDSKGLANVVCRDFAVRQVLDGRVVAQRHRLSLTIRLSDDGGVLSATPSLSERKFALRVELQPEAWASVEQALEAQDSLGRCGLLLKPERVLAELRALAARGIPVRLPDELVRSVTLPAQLAQQVRLGARDVELSLRRPALRVDSELVWSSARISATGARRPAAAGRAASPASRSGSV